MTREEALAVARHYLNDSAIGLAFDEGQLYTTYHARPDGVAVFERAVANSASGSDVALCDAIGAEIARRAMAYPALVAALRAWAALENAYGSAARVPDSARAILRTIGDAR
jgi:hypothetical protein